MVRCVIDPRMIGSAAGGEQRPLVGPPKRRVSAAETGVSASDPRRRWRRYRRRTSRRAAGVALLAAWTVGAACSGSPAAGPESDFGRLVVHTSTGGARIDADGYGLVIDGAAALPVETNDSLEVTDLPTGPVSVELTGVSSNCTVEGENPRVVRVEASAAGRTTFLVACGDVSIAGLRFDGTSHASAGDAPALDLGDEWTIEAWIRPRGPLASEQHLVSKWGTGLAGSYAVYIRGGRLQVSTRQHPKNTTGSSNAVLSPGRWQHVAVTFNAGAARIYIDGVLDNLFTGLHTPQISTTPLTLGYAESFACCHYAGAIDEVRIWRVERSAAEIAGATGRQLSGDEPGLAAYWRLDEGTGDVAADGRGSDLELRLGGEVGSDAADPTWITPGRPIIQ